jgi:hypothetical protein
MSQFLTDLDTRLVCEFDNTHRLLAPFAYQSDLLGKVVVVPEGFVTDYASVPRIIGAYLLYGDKGKRAGVVHDFLYSTQLADRKTCDLVFREALIASGYSAWEYEPMYAAVRLGGGSHWAKPNVPQTLEVQAYMDQAAG